MQVGRRIISVQSPDFSVFEIFQEFLILDVAHIPSPDYLGAVDGSFVPDPLSIYIVMRPVADEDELLAGCRAQLA